MSWKLTMKTLNWLESSPGPLSSLITFLAGALALALGALLNAWGPPY